jgi:hypothetical protein
MSFDERRAVTNSRIRREIRALRSTRKALRQQLALLRRRNKLREVVDLLDAQVNEGEPANVPCAPKRTAGLDKVGTPRPIAAGVYESEYPYDPVGR